MGVFQITLMAFVQIICLRPGTYQLIPVLVGLASGVFQKQAELLVIGLLGLGRLFSLCLRFRLGGGRLTRIKLFDRILLFFHPYTLVMARIGTGRTLFN